MSENRLFEYVQCLSVFCTFHCIWVMIMSANTDPCGLDKSISDCRVVRWYFHFIQILNNNYVGKQWKHWSDAAVGNFSEKA